MAFCGEGEPQNRIIVEKDHSNEKGVKQEQQQQQQKYEDV